MYVEITAATTRPVTEKVGEQTPPVDLKKDIFYQHFVISSVSHKDTDS